MDNKEKHLSKNPILKLLITGFNNDLAALAASCQPQTILDVGCGEGFTTIKISQKLPHSNIAAIDISPKAIRYAKQNNYANNITYNRGDISNLSHHKHAFDLVVCNEVLEHLTGYKQALANLCQSSSKYVLISIPNEPWFQLGNFLRLKYLKNLGNHPQHVNHWTKAQFKNLLSQYGQVVSIKTSSFWNIGLLYK